MKRNRTESAKIVPVDIEGAKQLTAQEACDLFDATAKLYLKISGDEFLRRYDAGEYSSADFDFGPVSRVAALISLVRH